ncbi:peroxidase 55 [Arachis duranensis]|uniref:Peroxidase n=1 Tax=Arachis duranensis TaxID=130453 RepID=A0A9C6TM43_ARADU|nr:peroxidase 55 [Arachis duranensis]
MKKIWVVLVAMFMISVSKGEGKLVENFYGQTCPNVESIVTQAVTTKFHQTIKILPRFQPRLLDLKLVDYKSWWQIKIELIIYAQGCDASVMIASPNGDAEKDASENLSLAGDGFDTVIKAKAAVEASCPAVVSCADILALATRDVIALLGGPSYRVELGRRDGLVSKASSVDSNLPKASFNLNQLNKMFSKHNLTQTDMIALSGAHTVGFSHCNQFSNRLYSFQSSSHVDPTLDPNYAQQLKSDCPQQSVNPSVVIALDPQTSFTFDNLYYKNLVSGQGLLESDQTLFTDPASQATVVEFANNQNEFFVAFVAAMRKLGRVGVKTGNDGEIRRDCTTFNS